MHTIYPLKHDNLSAELYKSEESKILLFSAIIQWMVLSPKCGRIAGIQLPGMTSQAATRV